VFGLGSVALLAAAAAAAAAAEARRAAKRQKRQKRLRKKMRAAKKAPLFSWRRLRWRRVAGPVLALAVVMGAGGVVAGASCGIVGRCSPAR